MDILLHHEDLPDSVSFGKSVAIDTETTGLSFERDRLCLVQLSSGDGIVHLVQYAPDSQYDSPNLMKILKDESVEKIFHFGRYDIAMLKKHFDILCRPVYCTKIASKLVRTYTDKHGLKDLCREILEIDISKQQQMTDWGKKELTQEQLSYAATDVLYLHRLKEALNEMLIREKRIDLAHASFQFLPTRSALDLSGWAEKDIFSHA